jgi:hypothetical protein
MFVIRTGLLGLFGSRRHDCRCGGPGRRAVDFPELNPRGLWSEAADCFSGAVSYARSVFRLIAVGGLFVWWCPVSSAAVLVELELATIVQDATAPRPLLVTAYELSFTRPSLGGTFNLELEGGQESDGGRAAHVPDFLFNFNQLLEGSPLKVGRIAWHRRWAGRWELRIGRFAPESYLDKNSYAASKTTRFLGRPFVRPTAVADPGTSLGLMVGRRLGTGGRIAYVVNDAHGTGRLTPFHTVQGEWFHAVEVQTALPGMGRLRLIPWTTEKNGRRAFGLSGSGELRLASNFGAFVRAGLENGGLARTSRLVAGGFAWEPAAGYTFALAGAYGEGPGGIRSENFYESYLRRTYGENFSASLHVQHSRRRVRGAGDTREAPTVASVRLIWIGPVRRTR